MRINVGVREGHSWITVLRKMTVTKSKPHTSTAVKLPYNYPFSHNLSKFRGLIAKWVPKHFRASSCLQDFSGALADNDAGSHGVAGRYAWHHRSIGNT